MIDRKGTKLDAFNAGDGSPRDVDAAIFGGGVDIPDSGRVVARPTSIKSIWADRKQPRRAVPSTISMHWDGNPESVPDLLGQWHLVAEAAAGVTINIVALLNGEGEGLDTDKYPSVAQEYIKLVRFAAGIKVDGLINPIIVVESDDKLLIESGERRWLAFHLLNTYVGEKWAKIPVTKGDVNDSVWRQCTENMQRTELNAIGKARQLALLIIATRSGLKVSVGAAYKEYEDVVTASTCDRRFYAQVADGNIHRIPPGMGERIQGAMDLSETQLARYRSLLRLTDDEVINDEIWAMADVQSWPEGAIREVTTLPIGKVREVVERANWTLDDLKALKEVPVTKAFDYPPPPAQRQVEIPRRPVTSEWMHKRVMTKGNQVGTVMNVDGDRIIVLMPGGQKQSFHYTELTLMGDRPSPPAANPSPMPEQFFAIGDLVRTRTGTPGEVVSVSGRLIGVKTANGSTFHDHTLLTKIAKPAPEPEFTFMVGDTVHTKLGRQGGSIIGVDGDQFIVSFPGAAEPIATTPKNLIFVNRPSFVPHIDEDNIQEDVDPDAPTPAREYSEGWTEGEGANNQATQSDALRFLDQRVQTKSGITGKVKSVIGEWLSIERDDGGNKESFHYSTVTLISDKASSVPRLFIPIGSPKSLAYGHFRLAFSLLGDQDAVNVILRHETMTDASVRAMGTQDERALELNAIYDQLSNAFLNVLQNVIADDLREMESVE